MSFSWLIVCLLLIALFVLGYACFVHKRYVFSKNTIRKLQQHTSQQEHALKDAQNVSQARNLFLASLSHELRTPLSGIMGATQLLKTTELNSRQLEYIRLISSAGTTVLEVVDDMLTFSRIHAGEIQLEQVPFNVSTVVDNMLAIQSIRAQERGIALVRDISPNIPKQLLGDRGKINQILLNLIGNAIKFTDEGSVTVTVRFYKERPSLVFTVLDTGIGMEPSTIEDMFKPFVQGHDHNAASERGGTGLGLAICKRLISVMGGEIQIESTLSKGTSVKVNLPVSVCTVSELQVENIQIQTVTNYSETENTPEPILSFTVLLIEDDEINRLVCTRYLALLGHHPKAAANASQAMQFIQNAKSQPDVILLDMNLAGVSGAKLGKEMRSANGGLWKQVPIIAISADISGAAQVQAQEAGITDFLAKPFSSAQLQSKLLLVVSSSSSKDKKTMPFSNTEQNSSSELLDKKYVKQVMTELGDTVMVELLNIFRSSSASTLQNLLQAVQRRDFSSVRTHAHTLQGSAGNLGMVKVALLASHINNLARAQYQPVSMDLESLVLGLEQCCHDSADAVRTFLLMHSHKSVTLASHCNN